MNTKRILYAVFAIFALCLPALPQSKTAPSSGKTAPNTDKRQPSGPATPAGMPQASVRNAEALAEYIIGPEDVIQIIVWLEPDLNSRVAVRPDGKIDLPLVNDI